MLGSEKRNELVVGLFLFAGLVLLGGLVLEFGRFQEYFAHQYKITVVFDDASGLIKGSDVRMGGARIGRVAKLPELTEAVQVEVEIAVDQGTRIPTGSRFQINSATLLGDKLIDITPPEKKDGAFIAAGSRVRGEAPGGLEALQTQAGNVSRDLARILKEAEVTLAKIDSAVGDLQVASKQLGEAVQKVNGSLLAQDNLAKFDKTMAHLADASDKIAPTLAEARDAFVSVHDAALRADKTLQNADETIASIKPALKEMPAAVANISSAAKKASDALEGVKSGKGLLGAMVSDNDVSIDAKAFMQNLRRFGILRYRNEAPPPADDPRDRFRGNRR